LLDPAFLAIDLQSAQTRKIHHPPGVPGLRRRDTEVIPPRRAIKCGVNFSTRVHVEKINATLLGGGLEGEEIKMVESPPLSR